MVLWSGTVSVIHDQGPYECPESDRSEEPSKPEADWAGCHAGIVLQNRTGCEHDDDKRDKQEDCCGTGELHGGCGSGF